MGMGYYYLTCKKCGKEWRKFVEFPMGRDEKEEQREWFEKNLVCPSCFEKEEQEHVKIVKEKFPDLPKLQGTPKQVVWAEKIRTKKIYNWIVSEEEEIEKTRQKMKEVLLKAIKDCVYINVPNLTFEEIKEKYYDKLEKYSETKKKIRGKVALKFNFHYLNKKREDLENLIETFLKGERNQNVIMNFDFYEFLINDYNETSAEYWIENR